MGWNSWNTFNVHIDEKLIKDMADAITASGMRDAGYEYICSMMLALEGARRRRQSPRRYPNDSPMAMIGTGRYLHSKGFKFGIYNCGRHKDLRRLSRQLSARGSRRQDVRLLGRRLSQVRLVQHPTTAALRSVTRPCVMLARRRSADCVQHVRLGNEPALDLAAAWVTCGGPPRHHRYLGRQPKQEWPIA